MKILVCVKQVLDPGGITVNRKAEKVFINREEFILDPASKAALEAANNLKQTGAEVIAISVGPERVEDGLREAWARGADRAIWIRSEGGDALVITNLIAAAVRKIGTPARSTEAGVDASPIYVKPGQDTGIRSSAQLLLDMAARQGGK